MKYKSLTIGEKVHQNQKDIERLLKDYKFYWVIDSEFEESEIEIDNNTLVWNSGDWLHGKWEYGIFKGGEFHGTWMNGIFVDGVFKGQWESGIDITGKINNQK